MRAIASQVHRYRDHTKWELGDPVPCRSCKGRMREPDGRRCQTCGGIGKLEYCVKCNGYHGIDECQQETK